jgi:hypothetical protein
LKEEKMKLGERTFSEKDQISFASFSGDFNPIHLDHVEARKLFSGQCIAHGMHSLLWVLEVLSKETGRLFKSVSVKLYKQVTLHQVVEAIWDEDKEELILRGNSMTLVHVKLSGEITSPSKTINNNAFDTGDKAKTAKNLKITDVVVGKKFEKFVGGDKGYAHLMFPVLTKIIGENVVYEIALLSSKIGMQVPGLHALFLGVKISLAGDNKSQVLEVQSVDKRFNKITLSYSGRNISATLDALFLPSPVDIPSSDTLRSEINELGDLSHVNALIIGGSRGLGAWTAKVIALAGGEVTLTYNSGRQDAELVKTDILLSGGKCNIAQLTISESSEMKLPNGNFNQLYYFPTPKILKQGKTFDIFLYEKFLLIYAKKFEKIAKKYIKMGIIRILYPSTMYIDKPVEELQEYIKAKLEGEKVCNSLSSVSSIKVLKPRIDRVLTDQTTSILPVNSLHPLEVVLPIVGQMSLK